MTLIAGVFSRSTSPLDNCTLKMLKNNLSRNRNDQIEIFQGRRVCLMKIDIGAFGSPGVFRDNATGSVTFVAGEPLLKANDECPGRERIADVEELHHDLKAGSLSVLRSATGIFSVAHYDEPSTTLTLATDKMGHRAIYYWVDDQKVVFASVLRILESLPNLSKTLNALALGEMTVFPRHPLGSRTAYCEVNRMLSGELLQFRGDTVRSQLYFDFGSIPEVATRDQWDLVRESHQRFMSAIRRRLRSDRTVVACLSGGLDSRMVVSGLRALDTRVYTVNMYQFYNSQDRVYAAMLAKAAGTVHGEVHVPAWESGKDFEQLAMNAAHTALTREAETLDRPQLLWTGDGGSVSSGHLLVEPHRGDMARQGRMKELFADYHLGSLSRRVLTKISSELEKAMFEAFLTEMSTIESPDPARAFHIFLIKDHQRKDFVAHFEHIDIHRIEFQCPFYDSHYLESIVRLPFDWTVAHRFYHKWMRLFPAFATAVPWQTYDEHEPCPLPPVPGVARQWDREVAAAAAKARRKGALQRARESLFAKPFPHPIIRRNRLALAALLHWSGLRNCESAINAASTFCQYWSRCNGAYLLDSSPKEVEKRSDSTADARSVGAAR